MINRLDTITINKLEINTIIGTYPFERLMQQKLFITTQFATKVASIAQNDDINQAIDYEKMSLSIVQFGVDSNYFLIETFAEKLSEHLLLTYPLSWLKLEITKPAAIKNAQGVTISIERTAEDA